MKFKINSHTDTFVNWTYEGQLGTSDTSGGEVQDTYLISEAFDLTLPVERMVTSFVDAWLNMQVARRLLKRGKA